MSYTLSIIQNQYLPSGGCNGSTNFFNPTSRLAKTCQSGRTCGKGYPQASSSDVEQLGQLYRIASSDLALAQRDFPKHAVTTYLNQLVAHGHAVIYRSEPLVEAGSANFLLRISRSLPANASLHLCCRPVVLDPGTDCPGVIFSQPDTSNWLLDEGAQSLRSTLESGKLWTDIPVAQVAVYLVLHHAE